MIKKVKMFCAFFHLVFFRILFLLMQLTKSVIKRQCADLNVALFIFFWKFNFFEIGRGKGFVSDSKKQLYWNIILRICCYYSYFNNTSLLTYIYVPVLFVCFFLFIFTSVNNWDINCNQISDFTSINWKDKKILF